MQHSASFRPPRRGPRRSLWPLALMALSATVAFRPAATFAAEKLLSGNRNPVYKDQNGQVIIGATIDNPAIDVQLYVSSAAGARDTNDGRSAARPVATINGALKTAVELLSKGQSVKINVGAGTYHEAIKLDIATEERTLRDTPLVIEGDANGQTFLSGAQSQGFEAASWQPVAGHPGLWSHSWNERRPLVIGPWQDRGVYIKDVSARSEMLLVDGQVLMPVELEDYEVVDPDGPRTKPRKPGGTIENPTETNVPATFEYRGVDPKGWDLIDAPWEFAVADNPASPAEYRGVIAMRLPDGKTPADYQTIEIGAPYEDGGVTLRNKRNIVLRDMTVRAFATPFRSASVTIDGCVNGVLDNFRLEDVGGIGVNFGGVSHFTLRDSTFTRCGQRGFGGGSNAQILIEDCHFDFNNWRGALSGFNGWDTSGTKIARTQNAIFRRCTAIGNKTHGFWIDISNRNVTYDRCLSYGNYRNGFFFELSGPDATDGGDTAINCVSANNGEWGFWFLNIRRPTAESCLAINNELGQFGVGRSGDREPFNAAGYETHTIINSRAITQNGTPALAIYSGIKSGSKDLMEVLRAQNNRYESSQPDQALMLYKEKLTGLAEWQQALAARAGVTMNDQSSTLVAVPSFEQQPMLLTDADSPLVEAIRAKGVPLPIDDLRAVRLPVSYRGNSNDF